MLSLRPASNKLAFTLIELLTVIFIIGVLLSLVMLAPGLAGKPKTVASEALQLADKLRYARQQSILTGIPYAWSAYEKGYYFLRPVTNEIVDQHDLFITNDGEVNWEIIEDDSLLRLYDYPFAENVLHMQIQRNGINIIVPLSPQTDQPMIVMYPTGEIDAFSITFTHKQLDKTVHIRGDTVGRLFIDN